MGCKKGGLRVLAQLRVRRFAAKVLRQVQQSRSVFCCHLHLAGVDEFQKLGHSHSSGWRELQIAGADLALSHGRIDLEKRLKVAKRARACREDSSVDQIILL